jgi:integral membrane protein
LLLGIAMPLKYYVGIPEAVKYTGWAHGILFIAYVFAVLRVQPMLKWGIFETLVALSASMLPLGPFLLDSKLKKEQQKLEALKAV